MDVDAEIAALYAGPLAEFVAARDRLAARLAAEDDPLSKKRAAEVKALRKPALPVWAANRLAAAAPTETAELIAKGAALREAHARLLAGGSPEDVRALVDEERGLVDALASRVPALLEQTGQKATPGTIERVRATLSGLATDPAAAEGLRAGRLDREVTRSGFGPTDEEAGEATVAGLDEVRERRKRNAEEALAAKRARRAAERARREADELARRAKDLEAEAEDSARRAAEAKERAEKALALADEAEREADRLERS